MRTKHEGSIPELRVARSIPSLSKDAVRRAGLSNALGPICFVKGRYHYMYVIHGVRRQP